MTAISVACLDMAGTTVRDDGVVMDAFRAAVGDAGPDAMEYVRATMGQSKIEVFRHLLGDENAAQTANTAFEDAYGVAVRAGAVEPLPGAEDVLRACRSAGVRVCLSTGFSPVTRDAILDALGWRTLADLVLSPADAGRGRPWPDMPLTALLRLGGGAVSELAVVGDTPSDVESGLRAGAGLVAGVLTGSATRDDLAAAGAPVVLDDITGLLGYLLSTGLVDNSVRFSLSAVSDASQVAGVLWIAGSRQPPDRQRCPVDNTRCMWTVRTAI
jgi:phosphonatase-like hydrolase